MKIGIDLHGVITDDSPRWRAACHAWMVLGYEVYILTGSTRNDALTELYKLKMFQGSDYTNIVSVTDFLLSEKLPWQYDKHGRPSFDLKEWNSAKGRLAELLELDVHYDDTLEYAQYFKTTRFEHYTDAPPEY